MKAAGKSEQSGSDMRNSPMGLEKIMKTLEFIFKEEIMG